MIFITIIIMIIILITAARRFLRDLVRLRKAMLLIDVKPGVDTPLYFKTFKLYALSAKIISS